MSCLTNQKPVTVPWVRSQKRHQKMTMLTAYDYPTAVILDEAGIDILLVGDSLAMVLYGEPNTLSVTLDDMLRHTLAVSRGAKRAMVIGDMPFMSYQVNTEQALLHAGRFLKEARAQGVKLEGGLEYASTVQALTRAGIPVIGHIGLTPQSIHAIGSYRMHGKMEKERTYLLESAQALAEAGAFSIVLECVEKDLAHEITEKIEIPTFGIGASPNCDGQVLVTQDLVGLSIERIPKFVHPITSLKEPFRQAILDYIERTRQAPETGPLETRGEIVASP